MDWFIEEMKNPFSASMLAGILVFVFMYVDGRVSRKRVERSSYIKNIAMTMFVVGLVVYCISAYGDLPQPGVSSGNTGMTGGSKSEINYNTGDIRMNMPDW